MNRKYKDIHEDDTDAFDACISLCNPWNNPSFIN